MRYVIVGNSAAGVFAAEAIRSLDRDGQVDIISDENYPAYARCLTSYYLSGAMEEKQLLIRSDGFYKRLNLRLHKGKKVTGIDIERREVMTEGGDLFGYDRLLVASGASPSVPPIPGIEAKGVFGLRTLEDAKKILSFCGPGKQAVVIGGGFVALKAAYALLRARLQVTCVISSGQVLSQMLDRDAAAIVAGHLASHGMRILYNTDVAEILPGGSDSSTVRGVKLTSGEDLLADVVIVGKGVTPNTGFLKGSGVVLDSGIPVNEYMQTNLPDVFAAGDVARAYDLVYGDGRVNAVWPNAAEQGAAAGSNMAGVQRPYHGSIAMNSADFFGLSTIAAGITRAKDYETVRLHPGPGQYLRLVFREDTLVGYIMAGNTKQAGVLTSLIREQIPIGRNKDSLMRGEIRQRLLW